MRVSSSWWLPILGAWLVAVVGCTTTSFVAVDPFPCADGGAGSCGPGLLDGLVGYWRLNDGAGSLTARDWSSWGNDGTLVNLDPATSWVAGGPEGTALDGQGKGHVTVADSSSIDSIVNRVTVAAWVFLDQTNTEFATAISRQIGIGFGQSYHLSIDTTQQAALYITTPSQLVFLQDPSTAPLQTWIHLAGTWDGAQARLYVNGVEVASAPTGGTFAAETNPVVLAGNGNGADRKVSELFPGRLDDVVLYRRALAPDEIARLATGPLLPGGAARFDAGGP